MIRNFRNVFGAAGFALSALLVTACSQPKSPAPVTPSMIGFADFATLDSLASSPTDDPACSAMNCKSLRQEFRYVVYVGKQIYAYWDIKKADTGTDYDALASTLEKTITDSTVITEYYQTLRRWASSLHDGHVNVMPKDDMSDVSVYTAPIRLEVLAPATDHEKIIVADSGDTDGMSVGDEITAINGVQATQALDQAETVTSGSTKRMRRFFGARRLVDTLGFAPGSMALEIAFVHGGVAKSATLYRNVPLMAHPSPVVDTPATGVDALKAKIIPTAAGPIGYLKIDGFGGSQDEFLLGQAMDLLSQTKGLLLDVRKNGGGDQSGNVILARLAHETIVRYKTSENMSDFVLSQRPDNYFLSWTPGTLFADFHDLGVKMASTEKLYGSKPVVALTSPNCFSACDTFVSALKTNHLATIAGEGSGGGTGSPLVFSLPFTGFQFRYSVVRGLTAAGDWIEGNGTLPDFVIEPTQAERAARKDVQLAQAVGLVVNQISRPAQPISSTGVPLFELRSDQDLNLAPTLADDFAVKKISKYDEL